MAYSLNDPYRGLRRALRVNGLLVGLAWGGLLLVAPQYLQALWLGSAPGSLWIWRMGGAGLVAMGLTFLEISWRPVMSRLSMLAVTLVNGVLGGTLFQAYVSGAVAPPDIWGKLLLLGLFLCNLACVILPWGYLGEDLLP